MALTQSEELHVGFLSVGRLATGERARQQLFPVQSNLMGKAFNAQTLKVRPSIFSASCRVTWWAQLPEFVACGSLASLMQVPPLHQTRLEMLEGDPLMQAATPSACNSANGVSSLRGDHYNTDRTS